MCSGETVKLSSGGLVMNRFEEIHGGRRERMRIFFHTKTLFFSVYLKIIKLFVALGILTEIKTKPQNRNLNRFRFISESPKLNRN